MSAFKFGAELSFNQFGRSKMDVHGEGGSAILNDYASYGVCGLPLGLWRTAPR